MTVTPSHTLDATSSDFALAAGFRSAATACGLKPSGNLDLGMVWSDGPCSAAGVFTTNRVLAAPVHVCLDTLAAAAGRVRGVLYNSGCANAVTGERGIADARRMAQLTLDSHLEASGIGRIDAKMPRVDEHTSDVRHQELGRSDPLHLLREPRVEVCDAGKRR